MKSLLSLIAASILLCASCQSQDIRILVLNKHGKPIPNECLNISLGTWHGADLFAPTNQNGVATLSFLSDRVSAEPLAGSKACGNMTLPKRLETSQAQESIAVLPDYNVSCQYPKTLTRNPAWLHNPLYQSVIPAITLQNIRLSGVVAANTCSDLKPAPVPGKLILIVRKVTFIEGMRS